MSEKNIIEILSSDTLETIVDKLNGNFRQLSSLGGGPQGPQGKQGIPGLPGLQGPQGIQGEEGEAGTKIVPISDNGWPLKEDMEENTLYFGMDGNGNLMIRTLNSDASEIEETEIVSNEKIDLQGFFEQLYVASNEQTCLRMCKQYSNEPILLIGRGEGSESIFANTINNSTDLFPNVHSKLQLNTTKNRTKTVKVYPGNAKDSVSSYSSSMVFMSNENGSASIGLVSSSPIGPNGVIVSGYDNTNSDLYVDGDIYSFSNFLTQFSGTKTFGGVGTDGTDGTFNFGHVSILDDTTTLKGGMSINSDAVTVKSVGNMTLSSGNAYTIKDNRSDANSTLITLESNNTEDSQILSITKNAEPIARLYDDVTSFDFTLGNLGVTTTGLAGARKWEWESATQGNDYAQFIFNKDDKEKGGLYIDLNRLSYYGNDGMQIKLNSFDEYSKKNEDKNGSTLTHEHNLIEFAIQTNGGSSISDYSHVDSLANLDEYIKIGDITGSNSTFDLSINAYSSSLKMHDCYYKTSSNKKRDILASYKSQNNGKTGYTIDSEFLMTDAERGDGYIDTGTGGKIYVGETSSTSNFFQSYYDNSLGASRIVALSGVELARENVGNIDTNEFIYDIFKTGKNTGKLIINSGNFGGLINFNLSSYDSNFNLVFVLQRNISDIIMGMFGTKLNCSGIFVNGQTDRMKYGSYDLEKLDTPIAANLSCIRVNNSYRYMISIHFKYSNAYKTNEDGNFYYFSKWSTCEFNLMDENAFSDIYWDSDDED